MSFADTKLKIDQKKAKFEKLMKSPNLAERTAAMLMHARAVNAENLLFSAQEAQKPEVEAPESLPKYGKGIDLLKQVGSGTTGTNLLNTVAGDQPSSGVLASDAPYSGAAPAGADASATGSWDDWNKMNKWSSVATGVLNGVDYFSKMSAIKKMQAPPKPVSSSMVRLNKTLDTGVERSALTRMRLTAERAADQVPGSQVSTAFKQKAGVDYLNQLSVITEKEQNFATAQGNQEAEMNSRIGMYNVSQFNDYTNNLNEFYNNKIAAKQSAMSVLLGKTAMGLKDTLANKSDMMKWDINSMKYDPSVTNDINKKVNGR